jgi:hypothetical protein
MGFGQFRSGRADRPALIPDIPIRARQVHTGDMPEPKFAAGAQVRYSPDITQDRKSGGVFEIVRMLPLESNGYQYRIRNSLGVERIASESQLDDVQDET